MLEFLSLGSTISFMGFGLAYQMWASSHIESFLQRHNWIRFSIQLVARGVKGAVCGAVSTVPLFLLGIPTTILGAFGMSLFMGLIGLATWKLLDFGWGNLFSTDYPVEVVNSMQWSYATA